MMRIPLLLLALAPLITLDARTNPGDDPIAVFTEIYDGLLKAHVADGRVDYAALHADRAQLDELVEMVGAIETAGQSYNVRKAFHVNAYNLLVLRGVVDRWPLASPLDDPAFFSGTQYLVAGRRVTLSELENEIIRPEFGDPRIHFALVCAARGCPPLIAEAFRSQRLDMMLNDVTYAALHDPDFVRIDRDANTVGLSKIFEWYREDFTDKADDAILLRYIGRFREDLPEGAAVTFYAYDWRINAR